MTVTFVIRHLSDTSARAALEEYLADLSNSFIRYFENLREIHWSVSEEAGSLAVSCQLGARSGIYQARSVDADANAAARQTFEKLVKQRRRLKKQRIGGRRAARARASLSAKADADGTVLEQDA